MKKKDKPQEVDEDQVIPSPPETSVEMREWNSVQIIALPKEFMHSKIKRTQVWRSENVAVYATYDFYEGSRITGYEAFRIMKMPARSIMGKPYPPAEKQPNDEKWGIYGYDCNSLDKIMNEFVPILEALNYNGPKWKNDSKD